MIVKVRCECCGRQYELEVQNNCSKSCGAEMRERRLARLRKPKPVMSARAFLNIPQPNGGS